MSVRFIVLAAGQGTRMKSALPKVLHRLAGKPLLGHVLDTLFTLEPAGVTVVVGHGAERVREAIAHPVDWAEQARQLGTADAVRAGLDGVGDGDTVLVTYGDVPLIRADTYRALVAVCSEETMGLLTLVAEDPSGYGRVLRAGGKVVGVVEHKDATEEEREIDEINAGVVAVRGATLRELLARVGNDNAQGEYYLTDIVGLAVRDGLAVEAVQPESAWEVDGVNSRAQLARLERIHQGQIARRLMDAGVTLADPARLDVRGTLETGTDVEIDVNCVFIGDCRLGSNVTIGPNCTIVDSRVGDDASIHANTVLEGAEIGAGAAVGPFARLRPGTRLAAATRIGNFVETKNASIGRGSKANHLSYVGDSDVGEGVNIGAGTITCNYDGANKHVTRIEDGVFVGSNTALVAPLTLGAGATIGAGSTIVRDVAADTLALTRAELRSVEGWQRPRKRER